MLETTPAELIPLVKEFGFEGIIAKRKESCYEIGSDPALGSSTKSTKQSAATRQTTRWMR
jgi:hypothetical protein